MRASRFCLRKVNVYATRTSKCNRVDIYHNSIILIFFYGTDKAFGYHPWVVAELFHRVSGFADSQHKIVQHYWGFVRLLAGKSRLDSFVSCHVNSIYEFSFSISSSDLFLVSNRYFLKKKYPARVVIEKNAKQYPPPFGNAPVAIGNRNEIPPFTIQFEREPIDIPCDRMLFGNISPNKTQETAPMEEANRATKLTRDTNNIHAGNPVLK